MTIMLAAIVASVTLVQGPPDVPKAREDLSVAIFMYIPDAHIVAEALERKFEKLNEDIDLDIDLIDPYKIGLGHGEVFVPASVPSVLRPYDLVEIDLCKLDDLRPYLDKLPPSMQTLGAPYAEPTNTAMARRGTMEYFVPHWACGNLVVTWTTASLGSVDTFEELTVAMSGSPGSCALVDFYGGTTLGEYYADWLIDHHGPDKAREILRTLGSKTPPTPTPEELKDPEWEANPLTAADIDPSAIREFRAMVQELHPAFAMQLSRYHHTSDAYPRCFADTSERGSVLIGYSERLFFVGAERALDPQSENPIVQANEVDVRPFAFGKTSAGTPVWIDGFVVPAGKLKPKEAAITKFLAFITSADGYALCRQPLGYGPAAHLLPASTSEYSGKAIESCPALPEYRDALRDPVVLDDSNIWRGINYSGAILKAEVKAAAKERAKPAK